MPPAEAVARFRADLSALTGPLADARLAIAVSGGADSMALLALAAAALPGQVIVATIDHRLRPENAGEAVMVAGWCALAQVPHATLAVTEPRAAGDNLHDWARQARYRLLTDWAAAAGAALLATAHHADDQAETFLMRAVRGAGVAGLAGIRARQEIRPGITLVRPLLGWRRAELRALAQSAGLPFVDDPSNADDRFERTRVRALLAREPMLDAAALARAAAHAAEADATLAALEAHFWAACRLPPTDGDAHQLWLDLAGLPREIKRRLARTAIARVRADAGITRPAFDDAANIEPLLDAMAAGRAATQAGVVVRPAGTVWRFAPAPPRRSR
ncbi:tRNA lysidine(34) synthetase TilS [Sphingomonas sp.]|uniref:tRNA lysidine(34) synthetase TilS n=1 Tax=Sphingomonas sp. TaxID=28214 RepID=UPI001DADA79A|nr:tRNA lysidine(34) synthetase TilS [Sphingomonas sp.]MBX9797718.1 tRNA lysidine(34) synthetase TilS [Sphingomonas sp.]